MKKTWLSVHKAVASRILLGEDKYKEATKMFEEFNNDFKTLSYHSGCHKNYTAVKRFRSLSLLSGKIIKDPTKSLKIMNRSHKILQDHKKKPHKSIKDHEKIPEIP